MCLLLECLLNFQIRIVAVDVSLCPWIQIISFPSPWNHIQLFICLHSVLISDWRRCIFVFLILFFILIYFYFCTGNWPQHLELPGRHLWCLAIILAPPLMFWEWTYRFLLVMSHQNACAVKPSFRIEWLINT